MTDALQGEVATSTTMILYGTVGKFKLINSPFVIRYFSTYANPSGAAGHSDLVDELKPMRERLDAESLNDLASLMQRDLNDKRVAQELIPYLLGTTKRAIGFFPSILAVIVPKGYLQASSDIKYPKPEHTMDGSMPSIKYEDRWQVSQYVMPPITLPVGLLKIVRTKTEIIVIDGQHRANAFRFVSGRFEQAEENIYKPFYDGLKGVSEYDVDLPVTLIWFEADQEINPVLISRELFVDVNNTARKVNKARTILLDDRTVTCIATQEIYKSAATNRFKTDTFSLLHSAFDVDTDIADARLTKFTLTTPDIINDAMRWAFFSSSQYDELEAWKVSQDRGQTQPTKFGRVFPNITSYAKELDSDDNQKFAFTNNSAADAFRQEFQPSYCSVASVFFNDFKLLTPHYLACRDIEEWINTSGDSEKREVWRKVFCGGEGLYWSFESMKTATSGSLAGNYRQTINKIEDEFQKRRVSHYGNIAASIVDSTYQSFVTKAFQIGYVCAVDYLVRKSVYPDWPTASNGLVAALNHFSLKQWSVILNTLRQALIERTDPKQWPSYRNLFIRMYDAPHNEFYNSTTYEKSPDYRIFALKQKVTLDELKNYNAMPDASEMTRRIKSNLDETVAVLNEAGLMADWYDHEKFLKEAVISATNELNQYFASV